MSIDHRIEIAREHFGCDIKPVEEFPGYFVGSDGSVFSQKRSDHLRQVRPTVASNGYPMVSLRHISGKRKYLTVHRLVITAFVGAQPTSSHEVLHTNGNRKDCRVQNLRWGTRLENCKDMIDHGRSRRGKRNSQAKLTEAEVLQIRKMPGLHREIAAQFGICRSLVGGIKSRTRWGWL